MDSGLFQPPPTWVVVIFLALAAVVGWAVIEVLLWLIRHIQISWIA